MFPKNDKSYIYKILKGPPKVTFDKGAVKIEVSTRIGNIKFQYDKNNTKIEKKEIIFMKEPCQLIAITEDAEIIDEVSKKAQVVLSNENKILISEAAAIPTIVYQFLKCVVETINKEKVKGEDYNVNLFHLIDMGVTYSDQNDGEKDGNFTPYTQPGQEFKLGIKDDGITEEE